MVNLKRRKRRVKRIGNKVVQGVAESRYCQKGMMGLDL